MAGHEKHTRRAERLALEQLARIGREIRDARLNHDLSQVGAGHAAGISHTAWGRIERGEVPGVPLPVLARALAVVGLDLHTRAYPGGKPLRDTAHVRLLDRMRGHVGRGVRWMTEVPLPNPGDRRAWDALIIVVGVRIGIEAETRARDAQELQRRLNLKQRDGGVDHVVLLLADTRHNRAFMHAAGTNFHGQFPVPGRLALDRLAVANDPGGSAIVLL